MKFFFRAKAKAAAKADELTEPVEAPAVVNASAPEPVPPTSVELVGGPLCGAVVAAAPTPPGLRCSYYGGTAIYMMESPAKAFYLAG